MICICYCVYSILQNKEASLLNNHVHDAVISSQGHNAVISLQGVLNSLSVLFQVHLIHYLCFFKFSLHTAGIPNLLGEIHVHFPVSNSQKKQHSTCKLE